jgi:hypothetical protein
MTILSEPGAALLVICAWCPDWDRNDPRNVKASHGVCESCLAKMLREPLPVPAREEAAA